MLLDDSTFMCQIRELIVHLESENRDQAELFAEDGLEFLRRSLSVVADRSKPLGSREPKVVGRRFGTDRLRETLFEYDKVLDCVKRNDFRAALDAAGKALETWESKSTPNESEAAE
jgi:hypothetical protein